LHVANFAYICDMKTFYELGYMDVYEAKETAGEMNAHHFHYYDSGMVTYKKEFMHLYVRGASYAL